MAVHVETLTVGMLAVNCYLVWDTGARDALIIDPGEEAERIVSRVRAHALDVAGVLLTHAHVDHIRAVPGVTSALGVPVYVHPADAQLYAQPENALLPWVAAAEGLPDPTLTLPVAAGLQFELIHTPGHTRGGVCYYFRESGLLFSGDTLFSGSIGRTDLPGGDAESLLAAIARELMPLPDTVRVLPGHGPETTIGHERVANPYVS